MVAVIHVDVMLSTMMTVLTVTVVFVLYHDHDDYVVV